MRLIDGIDPGMPAYGAYVVSEINEPRPGEASTPPGSVGPVGCRAWRVLAKLADMTAQLPRASATAARSAPTALAPETAVVPPATTPGPSAEVPTATSADEPVVSTSPIGLIGPGNRALTQDQLLVLLAADPGSFARRYVVEDQITCDGSNCPVVVYEPVIDLFGSGNTSVQVGPVDAHPDGSLVWTVPQALADFDFRTTFIVSARILSDGHTTWLDSDASAELTAQEGAFGRFAPAGTQINYSAPGLFLVRRVDTGRTCGSNSPAPSRPCVPRVEILARLETAAVP
jgi:hypothetical protein